jgi:hypothetical protein
LGLQKTRFEIRKKDEEMLRASMYFSYGRDARSDVCSKTTFNAVLAGERSLTTRFPVWPGYER